MTIIYLLIPLGLVALAGAIWAFFWAVRSGQFDDLETPAWRILLDDDSKPPPEQSNSREDSSSEIHSSADSFSLRFLRLFTR